MDTFEPLFDPRLFEGLGYEVPPDKGMSLQSINGLKRLKKFSEPQISLGDLHLMLKLFSPKLTATYPLLGGELKGTAKKDNYQLQYTRPF